MDRPPGLLVTRHPGHVVIGVKCKLGSKDVGEPFVSTELRKDLAETRCGGVDWFPPPPAGELVAAKGIGAAHALLSQGCSASLLRWPYGDRFGAVRGQSADASPPSPRSSSRSSRSLSVPTAEAVETRPVWTYGDCAPLT